MSSQSILFILLKHTVIIVSSVFNDLTGVTIGFSCNLTDLRTYVAEGYFRIWAARDIVNLS